MKVTRDKFAVSKFLQGLDTGILSEGKIYVSQQLYDAIQATPTDMEFAQLVDGLTLLPMSPQPLDMKLPDYVFKKQRIPLPWYR